MLVYQSHNTIIFLNINFDTCTTNILLLQKVLEVELPKNLPLSQRMINKGITADSINDEALKNFDFSFGDPDPSTKLNLDHQSNISTKMIEDKYKSSSAKPSKQTNKLVYKKNNTVI